MVLCLAEERAWLGWHISAPGCPRVDASHPGETRHTDKARKGHPTAKEPPASDFIVRHSPLASTPSSPAHNLHSGCCCSCCYYHRTISIATCYNHTRTHNHTHLCHQQVPTTAKHWQLAHAPFRTAASSYANSTQRLTALETSSTLHSTSTHPNSTS